MAGIKELITSASKILTASPDDTVGSVLENVKSSHEPVFVFDGKNFLGLVSVSQSLFKKRYPKDTKISTALINPPLLSPESNIFDAARQMISTKIYTLPVFDGNGKIIGVVSARSLLSSILQSSKIMKVLKDQIKIDKPATATIHSKIRDIYSTLRKEKTSRIVIVDEKGQIGGIITRRDVQQAFMAPPSKGRSNRTKNNRAFIIDNRDLKKFDFPIAEYIKIKAVTLPFNSDIRAILEEINKKKINSIILADKNNKPKGILSIRSFLDALSKLEPEEKLSVIFSDKHKIVDSKIHDDIVSLLQKIEKKVNKINPIKEIKVTIDASKNPKGIVMQYEVHLHINFKSGKIADTKVVGRNLMIVIREAVEKLNNQIKLSHKEKRR